ncbi:class I SAM-dependent RNA methyltransferase [Paraurantiacibacter namhicola]|uniref:23S rRNA (Uracil(1939)-C(5))-methyltransferase RlmD n=1 Tax=Paraurantiacibacter namhicola TaxID=645517 RepID=A0A1C7D9P0_9SPHN|nr:class I SAM-dependent RNA methyltransferase [Paraurantiacibacter namhicola]ANU08147.1 23S rRNA (uracil(1939)-C(5))-methyltransferase RlmD [Paraurantiacibacter namhicola]
MSETEKILRVAAKGDGVTASGRHVALAAPGDMVRADGSIEPGSHHAEPVCRHFGKCGGCELQHLDEASLAQFVTDRVAHAASGQGVEPAQLLPAHLSPPRSRRRATLHAARTGGAVQIGFKERRGHKIVDMRECHILRPELFALIAPLRKLLSAKRGKFSSNIALTLADQGVDCALTGYSPEGLEETEALTDFCRDHGLARLMLDYGYGPEAFWEPEPLTATLSGVPVALPPAAFLQATVDGEDALTSAVSGWLGTSGQVVDLFSGLGTFAFALPAGTQVQAVEAARDAVQACQSAARRAGRSLEAIHRDLFRNPMRAEELAGFDAAILDPPRAGAREQVAQLATSAVPKIAYVSCNPASWARDAATLQQAGYRLAELRPVGQFRWSTHVELASLFVREG